MGLLPHIRTWSLIVLAAGLLALSWVSVALAQAAGVDDDDDSDEFLLAALAVIVGVAAVGVVGWLAYHRRASRAQ